MRERLEPRLTPAERHRRLQAEQYRHLRRALRMRRRFAEKHAAPPSDPGEVSVVAQLARIPDFVPPEDHPTEDEVEPKPLSPVRTEADLIQKPGRFKHVLCLYSVVTEKSHRNLRKAKWKDEKEIEQRLYNFWKKVAATRLLGA